MSRLRHSMYQSQAQVVNLFGGPAGKTGPHIPFHQSRFGNDSPHLQTGRGDVSWQDCRARTRARTLQPSATSLHQSLAFCGAATRPRARSKTRAHHPLRRCPEPRESAHGLPVPDAFAPWPETRCAVSMPEPKEMGPGHWVACHLVE